jgi:hypothetical protein
MRCETRASQAVSWVESTRAREVLGMKKTLTALAYDLNRL